ncbi:DUF4352 domain-containing protein [Actinoplanes sp. NPDC026619]|uniref:DUF4352 domain-containing protein n=1 Tax=Actinoplanes sp. NPDC026619 TaxID=3155798 RepID=UPI0033E99181
MTTTLHRQVVVPAARRRRRWPWIAAAVAGAIAVGSGAFAATRDGDDRAVAPASAGSSPSAVSPRAEGGVLLSRTGADGAFIVTVTRLRCGVPAIGPAELSQRPKGEFCLVSVVVENAGREPRLFDGSAQRAVDRHGRAYAVDDRAAAFLNEQLLDEVPAATTVRGVLAFDVPAGTRLSALLIHGSAEARGARISLS